MSTPTTHPRRPMSAYIFVFVALAVAAFSIAVARQPAEFRVARSVSIHAPASAIFPYVNRPRAWEAWSPWMKEDPNITLSYAGPDAGVGASSAFASKKSGSGTSTIITSRPGEYVQFRLEIQQPFACTNDVQFTFVPAASGTTVTWAMHGPANLVCRVVGVFANIDKMVGSSFEEGLRGLKDVVEKSPTVASR